MKGKEKAMFKKNGILKTIAILLLVFTVVSVASYSIAKLNRGDSESSEEIAQTTVQNLATSITGIEYLSSIDLILENAEKGETFNIVEILPYGADANTDLKAYATNGGFAKYVLYAYKGTYEGTFTEDEFVSMVSYQSVSVNPSTLLGDSHASGSTIQEVLDRADLIYVNSPTYASYDGSNNMSEDVYNYLHTYVSKNKPIIMDFVTSASSGSSATSKTYYDFVNAVSRNHIRFRTYSWVDGMTADKFFTAATGSYYLKYSVNNLTKRAPGTVLVITGSDTPAGDSMYTRMEGYADIIQEAYFGKTAMKPEEMSYTIWNASTSALTVEELNKGYDYILIENDAKSLTMTDAVYNKLKALSESSKYILYDSRLLATSSGTISGTSNNYLKLLQLYVSDKGVEQRKNVLAITPGYFNSLESQGEAGIEGAKPVADLLNGSEYRDSSTTGAGGRKYRVLEIQPCYPVDLELAAKQPGTTKYPSDVGISGGYYTNPDQVLYGVTKEEIEEGTEYYAFEFSKAKIAYATGIPYDQIEVEAMSTNELISSKEVVLENYDLVYIGGDASALLPHTAIIHTLTQLNLGQTDRDKYLGGLTAFNMYTHTGAFVDYDNTMSFSRVGGVSNLVEFNGNDLTVTKRDQLKDYVDSGLPIIVDKLVVDAFEESYKCTSRLEQLSKRNIDPDSNMYQFLAYTYKKVEEGTATNVGWGTVDAATDETTVDNSDRLYGNTLGSSVTVYDTDCSTGIKGLVTGAATRPSLSISTYPKQYIEGNHSTTNTEATASFTAGVNVNSTEEDNSTYTVSLYVDADGDGMYSEEEEVDSASCASGGTVDLAYQLDEDFFGLVNWKIKATAPNGVLSDVKMGNAFFKVTSDMKKQVRVLQIMPVEEPGANDYCIGDGHSLYFCTECQLATKIIKNNVTNSETVGNFEEFKSAYKDEEKVWDTVRVGKHEHDFGIVKYDTNVGSGNTIGSDDWETNFTDELTHGDDPETPDKEEYLLEYGDYEFDLDIMTVKQFSDLCNDALDRTDDQIETAAALADDFLVKYQEEYAVVTSNANLAKVNLEAALYTAADNLGQSGSNPRYKNVILKGIGTPDNPGQWMLDGEYYKFWQYCNKGWQSSKDVIGNFDTLAAAYETYIDQYDKVVELKEQYKTNLRQAGDADTWLINNYDVIILGLADEFNGMDLGSAQCSQIEGFLDQGGSVINTHDTITAKSDGAPNMSAQLRKTFGMDRFHVVDYGDSSTVNVAVNMNYTVAATKEIRIGTKNHMEYNSFKIPISNKDIEVNVKNEWNGGITYKEVGTEKAVGEPINITFTGVECTQEGGLYYRDPSAGINDTAVNYVNGAYETLTIEAPVSYETDVTRGSFQLGDGNVDVDVNVATGAFSAKAATTEVAADGRITVVVNVKDGDNAVVDGIDVVCEYRGNEMLAQTADGKATFIVDPEQEATQSIYDTPTGCNYRRYNTEDGSKYFWTERIKAESPAGYADAIQNAGIGGYVKYNAPVGITDLYASCHSSSVPTSPYRYAMSDLESFDHYANVDGWTYEAKYGTRKAENVNSGGVTMFPFAISDELLISPTHSQTFSLDLEDEKVAVWYTLGASPVDSKLSVDAGFARYVSSYFAASPRDGMSNYFLYSKVCDKGNIFYTGEGHQLITGRNKDNNDERRLLINVIVNCVTKGVTGPKLKLYNKCDESGNSHENCDDLYVDPKNKEDNEKLKEEMNTLFYNESIEMYQYNIDESQSEVYPEFDFKAIAGTADIKEVLVFYDLNYGDGDGMDKSDTYVENADHVLITSYDKKDNVDGKRKRLRETAFPDTLELEEEYFSKNKNCTYIVIRVRDEKGKWKSARVKINIIPHLFDLTDATSDSQNVWTNIPVIDVFDKNNYTI